RSVTAESLSVSENVPANYVNQLLRRLKRAGLLRSHRGSGGGYALSRPAAQITLGQVLRAVEGDLFEDVCGKYTGLKKDCRRQGRCGLSPVWQGLGELIEAYFEGITLARLLEESEGCARTASLIALAARES
ncbi:MAG: Rrf2 family transcriptional regulator, partial [Elusimicrobia bacterium]|nr:Rrf2 family transcriptional regulator [Elusimicrobiota bacterium]